MAEQILDRGEKLYCLGQIVHNENEARRLKGKGLIFIDYNQFHSLYNERVLIRAHGEAPSTYRIAREQNIELIDGTCPVVKRLQNKIKKNYESGKSKKPLIIIYGKADHPEVIALKGQSEDHALVIQGVEELSGIELPKLVQLFSQTTMNVAGFNELAGELQELLIGKYGTAEGLSVNNSICVHVSHRQPGLTRFAGNNEVVIFVAGKKSSNGKVLFEVCRRANPRTYFISSASELKKEWWSGANSLGVCGATSTPNWLLEKVADRVEKLM